MNRQRRPSITIQTDGLMKARTRRYGRGTSVSCSSAKADASIRLPPLPVKVPTRIDNATVRRLVFRDARARLSADGGLGEEERRLWRVAAAVMKGVGDSLQQHRVIETFRETVADAKARSCKSCSETEDDPFLELICSPAAPRLEDLKLEQERFLAYMTEVSTTLERVPIPDGALPPHIVELLASIQATKDKLARLQNSSAANLRSCGELYTTLVSQGDVLRRLLGQIQQDMTSLHDGLASSGDIPIGSLSSHNRLVWRDAPEHCLYALGLLKVTMQSLDEAVENQLLETAGGVSSDIVISLPTVGSFKTDWHAGFRRGGSDASVAGDTVLPACALDNTQGRNHGSIEDVHCGDIETAPADSETVHAVSGMAEEQFTSCGSGVKDCDEPQDADERSPSGRLATTACESHVSMGTSSSSMNAGSLPEWDEPSAEEKLTDQTTVSLEVPPPGEASSVSGGGGVVGGAVSWWRPLNQSESAVTTAQLYEPPPKLFRQDAADFSEASADILRSVNRKFRRSDGTETYDGCVGHWSSSNVQRLPPIRSGTAVADIIGKAVSSEKKLKRTSYPALDLPTLLGREKRPSGGI